MSHVSVATSDGDQLFQRLAQVIKPRGRMIIAYSGGVDSTLVAAVARRVLGREHALVAIGDSASLPRHELDEARSLADELDLELIEVRPGEQDDPDYQANAGNRCYFCKIHLYETLSKVAVDRGVRFIANGTNVDDLGDHRPGLKAADEHEVISPLKEAGFTKSDVRILAKHLNLRNADKPASACLASRIPFGIRVTPERLLRVERAETALRELGFIGFRVRDHDLVARIELPLEQISRVLEGKVRESIVNNLRAVGYNFVALDLAGFHSGSGNVLLDQGDASTR